MTFKPLLFATAAALLAPVVAAAQDAGPPALTEGPQAESAQAVAGLVVSDRPRGSVIGAVPPETVLTKSDVKATGALDIAELLDAIAPQIGSARGRGGEPPVVLLNGQRISGFRELRDLPPDSISRVEILPEEVALKYGYPADQRVVNIVLEEYFHSMAWLGRGAAATEGGYQAGTVDMTRLTIVEGHRTAFNLRVEANTDLTEDERDIVLEQLGGEAARSLVASQREVRATVTQNRQLGALVATGNLELAQGEGRALSGLGETSLRPLGRDTITQSVHAGLVLLDGDAARWRWAVTGNADVSRNVIASDRDGGGVRDRAATSLYAGDLDLVVNGAAFRLPAGDATVALGFGLSTIRLEAERRRNGLEASGGRDRTQGDLTLNLDLPLFRRNRGAGGLGDLSFNTNAEIEQLSDFDALATVGAGLNWAPTGPLALSLNRTREEAAPTVQQMGGPLLETPALRVFDFTNGQTVLASALTGGDPGLRTDRRDVVKLGLNWKPFEQQDLRLRADYVRAQLSNPIFTPFGPTVALQAAYPERFTRDAAGRLIGADLRPMNVEGGRRETFRLGIDFSRRLTPAPPSAKAMEAFRQRAAAAGRQMLQDPDAGPPEGSQADFMAPMVFVTPGAMAGGPGPGQQRTLFAEGGGPGGRVGFSFTDTITLVDEMTVRGGMKVDYLDGDAVDLSGGRPRHDVEGRLFYANNGLGAFVSGNWRSASRATAFNGASMKFPALMTVDVRLFADLGQRFDLVSRHRWLEGASLRFEVRNLFDSKPRVRDAFGATPYGFQQDLIDPIGRTFSLTFRKGGGGVGG